MPLTLKREKTFKRRRRLFYPVLALLGFIGAAGIAGHVLWGRSLPEIEGTFALRGLQDKVEIYRDRHGVPAIFANSRADALTALGYVHASERFFSMEMNRRAGKGRLAEVAGADMLPVDKLLRALDVYGLAERSYAHYAPETQALIMAYVGGVNAWLETHRDRLPLEFKLLGITPEPWAAADSLVWGKLMALRLSSNMREELRRGLQLAVQPAGVVERLYPRYPDGAPVTLNPKFDVPARDAPREIMPLVVPPLPEAAPERRGDGYGPGIERAMERLAALWPWQAPGASNEWVVAGARSATGAPVLANDPHLGLEAPVLWYLARLVTPEGEVKGATVPGLPVVLLGQNSHIAWGFTTTNSDVQDIFIETIDAKDPGRYLTPEGSAAFVTRLETIKVKDAPDVTVTLRATRHGPVISEVDEDARRVAGGDGKVLALAFTGLGEADKTPEALLRLNAARNWDEFQAALQGFQSPPQNIVYADRAGHIGFTNPALVPVRREGDGRYPVDGASGRYDWRGMVPFPYVPRLLDPPGGVILNSNNAVVGPGYYWFGREWETPYRAQRIDEMLRARDVLTLDDHDAIQADVVSLPAREMTPLLVRLAEKNDGKLEAADRTMLALLKGWDFTMRADAPEPLIFEWWVMRLYDLVARAPFGKAGGEGRTNPQALHGLLTDPAGWCDQVLAVKSADCAPQVLEALQTARKELSARHGRSVKGWRWGDEHFAPLENKVMTHVPGVDVLFGLSRASEGGSFTVNRGGNSDQHGKAFPLLKNHGSGFRAVYDLGNPDNSRFMIATGQAGHPLSPHYADLTPLWHQAKSITIAGSRAALAEEGRMMVLTPAR